MERKCDASQKILTAVSQDTKYEIFKAIETAIPAQIIEQAIANITILRIAS